MTTTFLDTLTFLSPEQRAVFAREDLDAPEAFQHLAAADLTGPPYNLTLGKAGRVLSVARGNAGAAAPATIELKMPEPLSHEAKVARALTDASADPTKTGALVDLGVTRVVLEATDKVDIIETRAMLAHVAAGGPVGSTWKGQRVAETATLSTPPLWCSPRTSKPLQAGQDELTGTPWAELLLDGLCVAAYGYQNGLFESMSEETVLERLKPTKSGVSALRGRVETHMKASGVSLTSMEPYIVYQRQRTPASSPKRSMPLPRQAELRALSELFLAMFSSSELRTFLRYGTEGERIIGALPGESVAPAQLALAAADLLVRWGHTSDPTIRRDLRDRLVAARPRRVDAIDAVLG